MRQTRLYTDQPLEPGAETTLDERAARHAVRVLRLRAGDECVLFNGDGNDYRARLTVAAKSTVTAAVEERAPARRESPLRLTLAQGIARGQRMDYTLQKAVELGVASIAPVFCQRTEVRLSGERLEKRMAHWRGVIIAACEQSGRAVVPALETPADLGDWLRRPRAGTRLVLRPEATSGPAALVVNGEVTLLIGPEGGLSNREAGAAERAGFTPLRLGPRVLRTETAGPAAIAVLQALWGDMG